MPELIALRAVFGQDEANHGMGRYRVDGDGLVHVPPEAVAFLTCRGGFALAKTIAVVSAAKPADADRNGLVRLHHDDAGGCSYAGCEYPSDEKGDVLVPAEAAADLIAHGFVPSGGEGWRVGPAPVRRPSQSATGAKSLATAQARG
jgi:hypothetical protein